LTTKLLGGLPFILPPRNVVAAFEKNAMPIVQQIATHLSQSRTLGALRDALLPKLISGELRVRDAERMVEKVA
jgi:type I restriction enzyme S subunit